jgi:intron-binding protein aquarius
MTVALSRARLGLYILGRREVFQACYELRQAFELLLQRPDRLMLVTDELWPSKRSLSDGDGAVEGEVEMEGVEHLGTYVEQMTRVKLQQLEVEGKAPEPAIVEEDEDELEENEDGQGDEDGENEDDLEPPEDEGEGEGQGEDE